jgi:GNAT superfamily N-acetyltransferase
MRYTLRDLAPSDVPSAMELSIAASWNQTAEDWRRLLRLAPSGCRCIEDNGNVVATTTVVNYDGQLGWVGMVLTRPENRRLGLARRLMEDALTSADSAAIRTLKLDATDAGRPLYESLGFVVEGRVERWERPATSGNSTSVSNSEGLNAEVLALDVAAFGVSREPLLRDLEATGRCRTSATGFVCARSGRTARSLGPCVARSSSEARDLIAAELRDPSRWFWDLLPCNADAVACAEEFGFTPSRALWRMRRGEPIENNDMSVYATAGFEVG